METAHEHQFITVVESPEDPKYADMKAEIESDIVFTRDYGLGSAAGHAHVAEA